MLTYIRNAIQLPVTQPQASLFLVFTYTVTLHYALASTTPQLCSVAYTSALHMQCKCSRHHCHIWTYVVMTI